MFGLFRRIYALPWAPMWSVSRIGGRIAVSIVCMGFMPVIAAVWYAELHQLAVGHSGEQNRLEKLEIAPPAPEHLPIIIGRAELGQLDLPSSAAEKHVLLDLKPNIGWTIANIANERRLSLKYSDGTNMYSDRMALKQDDIIGFPVPDGSTVSMKITAISHDSVTLHAEDTADAPSVMVRFTHGVPSLNTTAPGGIPGDCRSAVGLARFYQWIRSFGMGLRDDGEATVARLGGNQTCVRTRGQVNVNAAVAIPNVAFNAARLVYIAHVGFAITPASNRFTTLTRAGETINLRMAPHALVDREHADSRLVEFTAGRTHYSVALQPTRASFSDLVIRPISGEHRIMGPCERIRIRTCIAAIDTQKAWSNFSWSPRHAGLILAGGLVLFPVLWWLAWFSQAWLWPERMPPAGLLGLRTILTTGLVGATLTIAISAVGGPLSIVSLAQVGPATANWPLPAIAAWTLAAVTAISAPGAGPLGRLIVVLTTVLVATGNIALATLGFATFDTRFTAYFDKSLSGLAIGAAMLACSTLIPRHAIRGLAASIVLPSRSIRMPIGLLWVMALTFVILALWLALGTEVGIGNVFQPSEPMKSLIVIALSSMIVIFLKDELGLRRPPSPVQLMGGVFVIGFVLGLILVVPTFKGDFSPVIIIVFTACISIIIVILMHWYLRLRERWHINLRHALPPTISRPGDLRRSLPFGSRVRVWGRRIWRMRWRALAALFGFNGIALLASGALAIAAYSYVWALNNPTPVADWSEASVRSLGPKASLRFRSWIELEMDRAPLLAGAPDGAGRIAISYPETGRQVMLARSLIAATGCEAPFTPATGEAVIDKISQTVIADVDYFLREIRGSNCSRRAWDTQDVMALAVFTPEIYNDFVATLLFGAFGRDVVLAIALVQAAVIFLYIMVALRLIWLRNNDERWRLTSTVVANGVVGFAVVMALQWIISWANTFGLLPVMGQPMTYAAGGITHFLLFGMMALLMAVLGSRLTTEQADTGRDRLPTPRPALFWRRPSRPMM